jgi:hypothetical protein
MSCHCPRSARQATTLRETARRVTSSTAPIWRRYARPCPHLRARLPRLLSRQMQGGDGGTAATILVKRTLALWLASAGIVHVWVMQARSEEGLATARCAAASRLRSLPLSIKAGSIMDNVFPLACLVRRGSIDHLASAVSLPVRRRPRRNAHTLGGAAQGVPSRFSPAPCGARPEPANRPESTP